MSASREKKNRQEVAASGVVDPKTARQAQEQAKERRSNRLYAIIAIAFVVVAIGLVVWNSNIIQRGTTAVTVEGESYSAAEVSYYYHNAYNSIVNSKYASLYGIDKNTALSQQSLNDTAKMMLGVGEDMTWDAYFRDAAKKSLIQLTMLKKGAAEKGLTFDDDMQKEIDSTLETFSTYAKNAGYSTSAYLKLMYGNNMTMSTFKSILKDTVLASHYQQDYIDSLTYTDEEVETYYNEHKNNFDVADYEYIYFKGTADSTKDADGNTVQPTDEENAAAKEAASANANAALEAVRNGLLMEKAADNYDNGTYTDRPTGTYSGDAVTEWVFNAERQEGDLTLIESGDNYYVVGYSDKYENIGSHRVDRIAEQPEILDEPAVPPKAGFSVEKYVKTTFRMYNAPRKEVELLCDNGVMDAIIDQFGPDVHTYAGDLQNFRVIEEVAVGKVFFNWIFGFEGKVRIKAPADVKEQYRQMVENAAKVL